MRGSVTFAIHKNDGGEERTDLALEDDPDNQRISRHLSCVPLYHCTTVPDGTDVSIDPAGLGWLYNTNSLVLGFVYF